MLMPLLLLEVPLLRKTGPPVTWERKTLQRPFASASSRPTVNASGKSCRVRSGPVKSDRAFSLAWMIRSSRSNNTVGPGKASVLRMAS